MLNWPRSSLDIVCARKFLIPNVHRYFGSGCTSTRRPDGLSSREEFEILGSIEDISRITTCGRREFYYYGLKPEAFENAVEDAMEAFPQYEFDLETQADQEGVSILMCCTHAMKVFSESRTGSCWR